MLVCEIDRRNGETNVRLVDYATGLVVSEAPRRERGAKAHQFSSSNGIAGTMAVKRAAEKLDAELGVPIRYVPTHRSTNRDGAPTFAWRAEFNTRSEKNNWLRAHKRYDADAGYRDPCPGDFRGSVPPEFS